MVLFNCWYLSAWLSCWRLWEESHIFPFGPFLRGRRDLASPCSKAAAVRVVCWLDAARERPAEAALSCGINRKLRAALRRRPSARGHAVASLSGRQVASGSSGCSGAGSGSAFGETRPSVRRNSRNAALGWRRIPPPEESGSRLPLQQLSLAGLSKCCRIALETGDKLVHFHHCASGVLWFHCSANAGAPVATRWHRMTERVTSGLRQQVYGLKVSRGQTGSC